MVFLYSFPMVFLNGFLMVFLYSFPMVFLDGFPDGFPKWFSDGFPRWFSDGFLLVFQMVFVGDKNHGFPRWFPFFKIKNQFCLTFRRIKKRVVSCSAAFRSCSIRPDVDIASGSDGLLGGWIFGHGLTVVKSTSWLFFSYFQWFFSA